MPHGNFLKKILGDLRKQGCAAALSATCHAVCGLAFDGPDFFAAWKVFGLY
jgi:hypothetical protein